MSKALRHPVLLVIAGILVMQTAWLLTVPPFRGSDEIDHAYRAASVARGDWVVGPDAEDGRGQLVAVPRSLVEAAAPQCLRFDYMGPDNCRPVATEPDGSVLVATAAGVYHPAYYWVVGVVASPFDGATALYVMRAMTALLCLLFLGLAAFALSRLPGRWPLAAIAVAATPVLVYSTTVVAPNGLEMSAGVCLWASLLALIRAETPAAEKRLLWMAVAAAVVMCTLRALGPIFVLMIIATVALLDWPRVRSIARRHLTLGLAGAVLVGMATAGLAFWTAGHSGYTDTEDVGSDAPRFRPRNLLLWQAQSVAAFPLRNNEGPVVVYVVVILLALALIFWAVRRASRRERLALGVSLGLYIGFPVAFMVSPLGPDPNFWQGRYALPYGVGVLLIAGSVLSRRLAGRGLLPPLALACAGAYAVAVAASWIKIRHDELTSNPASVQDSAWHPPSPVLLGTLATVASLLLLRAILSQRAESEVQGSQAAGPGVVFRLFRPIHARLLGTRLARVIWRIPGAHGFYRWLMPRLRPPVVEVDGHVLQLDPMDSLLLSVNGNYEPFEQELFGRCIRAGDTVLDIGAHIGLYTLLAARAVGESGKVVAFEPSDENYALLRRNIERNGYDNVVTVHAAVADVAGHGDLALSADNTGDNTLVAPGSTGVHTQRVETLTVDGYVGLGRVDVVKMDIQGAEPAALAGAARTLAANDELVVFTELSPAHLVEWGGVASLVTGLSDAGFAFYEISEVDGGVVRRAGDELIERAAASTADYWNLVCVKGARGHELLEPFAVAVGGTPETTRGPAWRS